MCIIFGPVLYETTRVSSMEFKHETLNKIQTQFITWGNPSDCNGSDVIICVTGNPGVPDFYIEFASELHKLTGYPVCVIGHAGHVPSTDPKSNVLEKQKHLFDLNGQVLHKLDLITNHIDKKSKIHFIAHSIGAWMTLELLDKYDSITSRVSSINFLFPTLQKMAITSNGKFLNGLVRYLHSFCIFTLSFLFLLPEILRTFLFNLYLKFNSLPPHYNERLTKFLNPVSCEKVLFLAYDEMDIVFELNEKAIDKIKHLTNVIYSTRDGWVPLEYMDDLKQFQPQLKMKQVDICHTFVMKAGKETAEMVAEDIKKKC